VILRRAAGAATDHRMADPAPSMATPSPSGQVLLPRWAGLRPEKSAPAGSVSGGRWLTGTGCLHADQGTWRSGAQRGCTTPVVGGRNGLLRSAGSYVRFGQVGGLQLHVALTRTPVTLAGFQRAGDDVVSSGPAARTVAGQGAKLVLAASGRASQQFNPLS